MLTVYGIENGAPQGIAKEGSAVENPFGQFPEGVDPFTVLQNMPEERLNEVKAKIDKSFTALPQTMIDQSAIQYIKTEYQAIGRGLYWWNNAFNCIDRYGSFNHSRIFICKGSCFTWQKLKR